MLSKDHNPVYHSLADAAKRPQDGSDFIVYITTNNRRRQSYRVGALHVSQRTVRGTSQAARSNNVKI